MVLVLLSQPNSEAIFNQNPSTSKNLENLPHPSPQYSSLELEITTRCDLFCPSCPRVSLAHCWIEKNMDLETFRSVSANFHSFETIHFRGWGEPLLNPDYPEMIRRAKESGAQVVLTTNGLRRIIPEVLPHLDRIIYRLEVGRAGTYERRNPSVRFNRVIFNISRVNSWRRENSGFGPEIELLFLKNKYTLRELPAYLETAVNLHPNRVTFHYPSFHVRPIDAEGELPTDTSPDLIAAIDARLVRRAAEAGLDLNNPPLPRRSGRSCNCHGSKNKSLYVTWKGEAAMCRESALPFWGNSYTCYIAGRAEPMQTAFMGNLVDHSLDKIAASPRFRRFNRACLPDRRSHLKPVCKSGRKNLAVYRLKTDPGPGLDSEFPCPARAVRHYR